MYSCKVRSYAKVNLSLNVTGTADGYHLLDSVAASVDIWDTLVLRKRRDKLVNVYMHGKGSEGIPFASNNAVRAAELFCAAFGTRGVDAEVYKDIPMGAGLGGSSADAAGILRGMAKLYGVDPARLPALAAQLGSDTVYMLEGGFARLTGRGEKVERLSSPRRYHMLLIFPKASVSTPACFAEYDKNPDPLRADSARMAQAVAAGDFSRVAENVYNALGAPACALEPEVGEALEFARSLSPSACAVTGSGSAVFALFEAEELCRWAKSRCRKFGSRVVHTVDGTKRKNTMRNPFVLSEEEVEEARGERAED